MKSQGVNEAYRAPKHKSTRVRKTYTRTESAGVEHGLSSRSGFDPENLDYPKSNNTRNPVTGNATARIKKPKGPSVSSKNVNFEIC